MHTVLRWLDRFEAVRPFTNPEAWGLFRLAAFAEAIGWTLLISGIIIRREHWLGSGVAVPIAGQLHGLCFLFYFAILIATFSSQHWPRWYALPALAAGIFPYGTILFEQAISRQKRRRHYGRLLQISLYRSLMSR